MMAFYFRAFAVAVLDFVIIANRLWQKYKMSFCFLFSPKNTKNQILCAYIMDQKTNKCEVDVTGAVRAMYNGALLHCTTTSVYKALLNSTSYNPRCLALMYMYNGKLYSICIDLENHKNFRDGRTICFGNMDLHMLESVSQAV